MMDIEDCFYLGYISKTFGFKGEVTAYFDVDDVSNYHKMESVFLLLEGKLVPFFIESISFRPHNREANIRFQGIESIEKSDRLPGAELYLPLSSLPPLEGNQFYFHEVTGYQAIDVEAGPIGVVTRILDLPGNPLFEIKQGHKEALIPVRDEFIVALDRKNKRIELKTPPGLLSLYF